MANGHNQAPALDGLPTASALDLDAANEELADLSAEERIEWAFDNFGRGLHVLTSCGTQASLVLEHVNRLDIPSPVIFLNTGFYPKETYDFKNGALAPFWQNRAFHEFGPPQSVIDYVREQELAYTNENLYDWAVKGRYLTKAVGELGVTALITGIHRDQTEERKGMKPLGLNKDGRVMVRAFVDWTDDEVYGYIESNQLPTHPMYPERKFVGDIHFMDETQKHECGMHLDASGKIVRGMDPQMTKLIFDRLVELDPEAPVSM